MKPKILRVAGLAAVVGGLSLFAAAGWAMAQRLGALREQDPIKLHFFIPIDADRFPHLGREVSIDTLDTPGGPIVEVRWGDSVERLPVAGRDVPGLGPIVRHNDWLRVMLLAGDADRSTADPLSLLADGGSGSRLVVAARAGAPGLDPETWGSAHYKDWVYTILTFDPAGGIERSERTYRELSREPHSWEFAAAMNVTPALHTPAMRSSSPMSYPNYAPVRSAMNSMGWTWPAAGVSVLALAAGAMMLGASFVSRRDP